jgi:glutamine synthetase
VVAVQHGLEMPNALQMAKDLYVDVNIFKDKEKQAKFKKLPASCSQSADELAAKREFYEKNGVFPSGMIDAMISKLKSYNDADLSERLYNKNDEIRKLVDQYIHCM